MTPDQSPAPVVDDDSHGPLINLAVWITLTASALATGLKIYIKVHSTKAISIDDLISVAAFCIAVGESATISIQVNHGLGSRSSSLDPSQLDGLWKAQYATHMLYVVSICVTKLTPLLFFPAISPSRFYKIFIRVQIVFIWLWIAICLFVVGFSCRLPRPWYGGNDQCIDLNSFWASFMAVDVTSQLVISLLPILLLRRVQMTLRWKRIFSMFCFMPNMLTIPVTITRYVYLVQLRDGSDYRFDAFGYALVTGIHPHLALIFTAISFIKPFVDSLIAIPQVVGDVPSNSYIHPHVYPATNFSSSVVTGTNSSQRTEMRLSAGRRLLSILRWSGFTRSEQDTSTVTMQQASTGPYFHLNDVERSASEAQSGSGETTRQMRMAGRPLVIMKTMTASVMTEAR